MNSHQIVLWYLTEVDGLADFVDNKKTQRYGQAFFNALPVEDQERLRGTLYDTFHSDDPWDCFLAVSQILTKN